MVICYNIDLEEQLYSVDAHTAMRLRVKAPTGKGVIMESIDETVGEFLVRARQSCNISSSAALDMLTGFPPSLCTCDNSELLSGVVKTGDSVNLRLKPQPPVVPFRGWNSDNGTSGAAPRLAHVDGNANAISVPLLDERNSDSGTSEASKRLASALDGNDVGKEVHSLWTDDDDSLGAWDSHEPFMSTKNAKKQRLPPKTEWQSIRHFDSMEKFNVWKSFDECKWLAGAHSDNKRLGHSAYQNYKCASHVDCKAQVGCCAMSCEQCFILSKLPMM